MNRSDRNATSLSDRLRAIGPSWQSLSSIGAFAILVTILMTIALPGMRGITPFSAVRAMGLCFAYALFGLVLGGLGRRLCLRANPEGVQLLKAVAWVSLAHVPFGTIAGARTLLALRARPPVPPA